ncbi:Rv0361 family membrane protein [Micromonospora sp. NPDC005161]
MTQPPSGDQAGPPALPPAHRDRAGPAVPDQPAPAAQPGPLALPAPPEGPGGSAPASGAQDPSAIPSPPPGYPPYQGAAEPKKKRGLLIAAIALVVIMVLCVGGGVVAFLTLRNAETGEGAKEPAVAVDEFLTAVYKDRDATKAASRVCAAARDDEKIAAKVAEVQKYAAEYKNPRFRWTSPKVDNQTGARATVSTRVTMTTSDEKVADQDLRFTVVQKSGWWVCEVA